MDKKQEIRTGRHCASDLHVHLVFVTRYRHGLLDGDALERLRGIFAAICGDFGGALAEMDGEDDHVHLLVSYPPKVSVSGLVNGLKGVSSRLLRRDRPDIAAKSANGALWSPSYYAGSCGGAPLEAIRRYIRSQRA